MVVYVRKDRRNVEICRHPIIEPARDDTGYEKGQGDANERAVNQSVCVTLSMMEDGLFRKGSLLQEG